MQVLQESVPEHVLVGGLPDDRRDGVEPGRDGCAQSSLTHDELVLVGSHRTDHDRLEHSDLADRVDELSHVVLVEDGPRLLRIRTDQLEIDLGELRAGDRRQPALCWEVLVAWESPERR